MESQPKIDVYVIIKTRKEIRSTTGTVLFEYKKSYKGKVERETSLSVKDEIGGIRTFINYEKDKWFKEYFTIVEGKTNE